MAADHEKCATSEDYAIGHDINKLNVAPQSAYASVQTLSCHLDATEILGLLTSKAELVASDGAVGLKLNYLVSLANFKRAA